MRAIICTEPGGPEHLKWQEVTTPTPGPGEVLIDVAATAVNRADILQRQGDYAPPPGASQILGLECSGVISELGPGVTTVEIGQKVTALLAGGGYAEKVAVPVGQLMSVPSGLDLVAAAGLPEVACTVWSNIVMTAHLTEGEWLLIHGGGSGIGTMAIQVARALGARVAVTAGSKAKLDICEQLGAEIMINYQEQDFVEVMNDVTGGRGVDVILDNMGAAYLERNVLALARNGRLAIIGMQGGSTAELSINTLLRKNGTVHAASLRGRPESEKSAICQQVERNIWPWVHAGLVNPVIGATLPLQDAAAAHQLLESGDVSGKIVLTVL
ncbi:MAG: NAD(P)H-quinone oxidoreductase [Actinobacteria bacterium]|nr:NAD(P)H-quinone oxidoreductase [Actinomycetota bacterium]